MPENTPPFDDLKKIIIRRIVRNYVYNRLDTLCLAFGRLPDQLDDRIWYSPEYQKWAANEWLSEDELERLMHLLPVDGLLDCLEAQAMLHHAAHLPENPPAVPPKKNEGVIIPFPRQVPPTGVKRLPAQGPLRRTAACGPVTDHGTVSRSPPNLFRRSDDPRGAGVVGKAPAGSFLPCQGSQGPIFSVQVRSSMGRKQSW